MAHYVNSQKSSKIGGSVTNKVAGTTSLRKVMTDKNINSQIDSDIGGERLIPLSQVNQHIGVAGEI
jgi:hypothetical protein